MSTGEANLLPGGVHFGGRYFLDLADMLADNTLTNNKITFTNPTPPAHNPRKNPMCLGIPGKVVETYDEHDVRMGKVEFGGVFRRVCLEHVPEVRPGDYVLVKVGFALQRVDEAEAQRVFQFLKEMEQLDELGVPPP